MKRTIVSLAIILMAAAAVNAQASAPSAKQPHHSRFRQHGRGMLAKRLHFTDQQKEQLKNINSNYHQQLAGLAQHDEITVKSMKEQQSRLRKDHKAAIAALLTPAQKEQLLAMKAQRSKMAKVNAVARAEKLKIILHLSDEQAGRLTGVRTAAAAKIKAIKTDSSLSREQKKEQGKALVAAQKEQLTSILTPAQLEQLEQMKQQQHRRAFVK